MTAARILHVDDEPDIREVVQISLGMDNNLSVWSCSSGEEALSTVGGWQPDLVLLDVMMPNMDGPTTLSRLRQDPATAGVPVIFMTARSQPREVEHFKSLGAVEVIPKPFDPFMLGDAIRRTLAGSYGEPITFPSGPLPVPLHPELRQPAHQPAAPTPTAEAPAATEAASAGNSDPAPGPAAAQQSAPSTTEAQAPAAAPGPADAAALRDSDARFAVDLCHDLRGPLTVIKMYAEILLDQLGEHVGSEEAAHFAIIIQRVGDLNTMIDKLSQRSHATLDASSATRKNGTSA